jgi:hypothetical protein
MSCQCAGWSLRTGARSTTPGWFQTRHRIGARSAATSASRSRRKRRRQRVDETGLRLRVAGCAFGRFDRLVHQREGGRRVPIASRQPSASTAHSKASACAGGARRGQLTAQMLGPRQRAPDLEHQGLHGRTQHRGPCPARPCRSGRRARPCRQALVACSWRHSGNGSGRRRWHAARAVWRWQADRSAFVLLRTAVLALGAARRGYWATFVLRTAVLALGAARRARGRTPVCHNAAAGAKPKK